MHQPTPGVERAVEAAARWASRLGAEQPRTGDYVLGLLDEEEGRPAALLARRGITPANVRDSLVSVASAPAPPVDELYAAARAWSITYRADPSFLTDAFLLVVLRSDPAFARHAGPLGLNPDELEGQLTSDPNSPVELPTAATAFHPPETFADLPAARILDANLNRAREALRVLEDYARFALNDRYLTGELKDARHALAAAADQLPPGLLLAARETLRDVGTSVTAAGEYDRGSAAQVAAVNFKRLQESLRSLEEYGKLVGPEFGRTIETLRYRTYTLERAVVRGTAVREKLAACRLYVLVTGAKCAASLEWTIQQAALGGADAIQLREKDLPDRDLLARAGDVRRWTRAAGVLFIVNDRPDVALLAEADGVHLGQDDMPVHAARRVLGPDALIGVSTHDIGQVRRAVLDGADYLGFGPVFPSSTKSFEQFPGVEFVRQAVAETSLPAFALGGITAATLGPVVEAGAKRVAVSAAVAAADDPEQAARLIRAGLIG